MKITIQVAHLAALMLFADKPGSTRPMLAGVHIEPGVRMVATNGHVVGVIRTEPTSGDTLTAPITIHVNDCAAIVKAAKVAALKQVTLQKDDGFWSCVCVVGWPHYFSPIDLPYPPWRRVIPANLSGEAGQFNASNLMLFKRASARLGVERPPRVMHNGSDGALVMIQGEPDFIGVVMPLRFTDTGWPGYLAGFTAQAAPPAPICA